MGGGVYPPGSNWEKFIYKLYVDVKSTTVGIAKIFIRAESVTFD